jgi:hypothetical protein
MLKREEDESVSEAFKKYKIRDKIIFNLYDSKKTNFVRQCLRLKNSQARLDRPTQFNSVQFFSQRSRFLLCHFIELSTLGKYWY